MARTPVMAHLWPLRGAGMPSAFSPPGNAGEAAARDDFREDPPDDGGLAVVNLALHVVRPAHVAVAVHDPAGDIAPLSGAWRRACADEPGGAPSRTRS